MMSAGILQQDTIHCFPAGLRDHRGQLVNAEVSAVVYDGKRLVLASDKSIPGEERSAVFALPMPFWSSQSGHPREDRTMTTHLTGTRGEWLAARLEAEKAG